MPFRIFADQADRAHFVFSNGVLVVTADRMTLQPLELLFLNGKTKLAGEKVYSVLQY